MVCRLKKSIYGLKQASRQWYLKFDSVVTENSFVENPLDEWIYFKVCGSRFIVLVLYVDDILLASTDMKLLLETKSFLSQSFEMKDLGEASFMLGIKITRDRKRGLLGISQESYIDKVLRRFSMENCSGGDLPMSKGDKFNKSQCPKNDFEKNAMKNKPLRDLIRCTQVVPSVERPMPIFCDNSATAKNNKRSYNSKQIELKFLHVRKKTEEQNVVIEDIRTTKMIVDPLSKPILVKVFNKHVTGIGLADSFDSIA
ncbi:hypothetical protein ACLB2K_001813 [Fragaria x ananassa]